MRKTDSIEVKLGNVDSVLRNDLEAIQVVNVSDQAIESDLNRR